MHHTLLDESFHEVLEVQAGVEPLLTGLGITEGVVWHAAQQCLLFSDLSASTVQRWAPGSGASVLRQPSNISNGNSLDLEGRLISCEHATSSIVRLEHGQRHVRVLATHYRGREFNSPNDLICDSRGRIWFTDPLFGRTSPRVGVLREPQLDFRGVFRLETDGSVTLVADDFDTPNGLCLLPGEEGLLVNDTARNHIRRFSVAADGRVSGGAVFADIPGDATGHPDGMKVDVDGRVYCTGAGGVHVLGAAGQPLGVIRTAAKTRNFCFGGAGFRTLFLAIDQQIARLPMKVTGVPPPTC